MSYRTIAHRSKCYLCQIYQSHLHGNYLYALLLQQEEKPDSQQNKQISKIKRLQDLGLTNDEIVELLDIPLELIESLP